MAQKKRTIAEWETIIAEQKASGLTQEAWCKTNSVNYHTFLDRSRRIRRQREKNPKETQWLEAREAAQPIKTEPLQIEIGVFRMMVSDGFSEAAFLRVCKALTSLC